MGEKYLGELGQLRESVMGMERGGEGQGRRDGAVRKVRMVS